MDIDKSEPAISNPFRVNNNMSPTVTLSGILPDSVYSDRINISYQLSDTEEDTLSLTASFSIDGGLNYQTAAVTGIMEDIGKDIYTGTLEWDTETDLADFSGEAVFKITPSDNETGTPDSISFTVDNFGICLISISLPDDEIIIHAAVSYTLTDPNNRTIDLFTQYSTDNSNTWFDATSLGAYSGIDSDHYTGLFVWKSGQDLEGYEGPVMVLVTPYNGKYGTPDTAQAYVDYNNPPIISADSLTGEQSGDVSISFRVSDDEKDTTSVVVFYSPDSKSNWYSADVTGNLSGNIANGETFTVIWHSGEDLPGVDSQSVWLRMTAVDLNQGEAVKIGPIHLDNNSPPGVELSVISPDSIYGDYVDIYYNLFDAQGDTLGFDVYYSTDNGSQYQPAAVAGSVTGITQDEYYGSVRWNIENDISTGTGEAIIMLIPFDNDTGTPDSLVVNYNLFGVCNVALTLPDGEQTSDITVEYEITDVKNNPVSLYVKYSTDSGQVWISAATQGIVTDIDSAHYQGSFVWESSIDLSGFEGTVKLFVIPNNGSDGITYIAEVYVDYNEPPSIVLDSLSGEYSGSISVGFNAVDTENDPVSIHIEYSLDGGENFLSASQTADSWDTMIDLGYVYRREVYLRVTPYDIDEGEPSTAGPFTVTNFVGDYNHDLAIDGDDLPGFIDAWNTQEISHEIGPVSGTPPQLTVLPDGKIDFEDLVAFTLMWNWYSESESAKQVALFKPAAHTEFSGDIRLILLKDGSVRVVTKHRPDYMKLLIEPLTGVNPMIELTGTEYWAEKNTGAVFTRVYSDGMFEIASALFKYEPINEPIQNLTLAHLRINGISTNKFTVHYKLREHGEKEMKTGTVSLSGDMLFRTPGEFTLLQNRPNPFNPKTTIEYILPVKTRIALTVYNTVGQKVAVLKNGIESAGRHSVVWDAVNVPSGLYFYTLETEGFIRTRKMLLLK